jgi:nitroreductase
MDAIECIKSRMSIRKFKPEPVPQDALIEIIDIARWSPSYKNSQPWEVVILSGKKKEDLSAMLIDLFKKGTEPCPDIPEPESWPEPQQARINDLYAKRARATGMDLNDPEVIKKAKIANFGFYRAPHAIYLVQDGSLNEWSIFDIGLFAQTLMLAAHARGIGSVPQAFATDYARYIKEFLGIAAGKRLVLGMSVGYPDMESPVNSFRTDRVPVSEIVTWME